MENPPPADRYADVKSKYDGSQFRVEPQINTYYFWMNTEKAPFDDLKVRQAVNYASTRRPWNGSTPVSSPPPTRSCRRGCRGTSSSTSTRTTWRRRAS